MPADKKTSGFTDQTMPAFTLRPTQVKRILVTRMKFIGDVVLTTPLLHSLRAAHPSAHIAYMAEAKACSLLEHHPAVDELIGYDFSRPAVLEQVRVALALRRARFDVALDLFSNPRSALLTYLSGARVRVGLARAGRGRLFTHQVHDDGAPKTAIEFHNQFLHAIGVPPTASQPTLVVTAEEKGAMSGRLRTLEWSQGGTEGRLVILHAGATWPAKQWGAEQYAKLAALLARSTGVRILLIGGPRDAAALKEVEEKSQRTAQRIGPLTLRELAALLSLADAFVGNDGGPMHISAAVGTPTVGIFGPGEEQIWFAYPALLGHRALREDVPCHPCHLNVCNRPGESHMECMKKVTPERVMDAVLGALDRPPLRLSARQGN
jgi:lipopolysaccharide heptosyltransferase II